MRTSVTHVVTLQKIAEWLEGGASSLKEFVLKERLREILQDAT
jgi:hypothetical protein